MSEPHIPSGPFYVELAYQDANHPGGDFHIGFAAIDGFATRDDAMRLCEKVREETISSVLAVTPEGDKIDIGVEQVLQALIRAADTRAISAA